MLAKTPLLVLSALAVAALACGFSVDLPNIRGATVKTGPTQTDKIQVPASDANPASVDLHFAAGKLMLAPGSDTYLIDGTATYNVEELKPIVSESSSGVSVSSWKEGVDSIPFNFGSDVENTWDLQLGTQPMDLTIAAGAYQARMDFGGLSIASLSVQDGASDVQLDFSEPNQVQMSELSYFTGASSVDLTGLANANFENLVFEGGAGSYTLEFTGNFTTDGDVNVKAGLGQVTLVIPDGIPVEFDVTGGVTNVDMQGSFQGGGRQFNQSSPGPTLVIHVDMGAGNLTVRNP